MKPNPKNHLARSILSTIAAPVALVFTASHVHAATAYTGVADDWADETNWTPNVAPDGPAGAFNQRLNFTGNTTVTFTAAQGTVDLAGNVSADSRAFVIGNTNPTTPGTTSVLNITGGTIRTNSAATNASSTSSSLVGANGLNSNGTLNVSGTGTLDLTPATDSDYRILSIGLGGTANTGISGTINLSGGGLIKVSQLRFAETAPSAGGSITGVLNLNGGTLETGAIQETGGTTNALIASTVNLNGGLLRLTAATGISASVDTVNVLSGGANIEVGTGVSSAGAEAMFDGGGGGGLTKTGDGSLALSGNNTYTGPTRINAGTLRFATQGSLYNNVPASWTAANINALSGTTLAVFGDSAGTAGFTSTNLDTLLANVSVANTATEGLQAGAFLGIDTTTATGASFTQGNAIADSTGANGGTIGLTKLGSGALVLDKTNTYTGTTTIAAGAIVVTANNALSTVAAGTTVAPNASLALSGGIDYSATEAITGSGLGSAIIAGTLPATQRGLIQSVSANNTFRGNVVVDAGGTTRFGSQDGASLTLTGTITQATGNILFRAGNGPLLPTPNTGGDFITLSNAGNSFGANSTIFTGAATGYSGVRLGITNALPIGLTISGLGGGTPTAAGTALDLNGFNQSLNGLIGTATLNIINTNTGTPSTLTLNPTTDQSTTGTLILGGTGLTGPLGTINLIKEGTFSQTLAGVNTYSGTTTVNDGTLLITGNSGGATGAVSVNNTGTLGGTGTIGGNVTVAAAANLAPGASSAGTLTINGNLDLAAMAAGAGQLKFELDALAGTNDLLDVGGTLTIGSGDLGIDNLEITNLGGLEAGTYTLITCTSPGGTVNATSSLIATGFNGQLQINGNDLQLVVTPTTGGYAAWQTANSTAQTADLDHDNDGVSNGVEWFLFGSANSTGFTPLPGVANNAGTLSVTWTKAATFTGAYDTDFVVETSSTLVGAWATEIADPSPGFTVTFPSATEVKYTFPTGTKNFARLKVFSTP